MNLPSATGRDRIGSRCTRLGRGRALFLKSGAEKPPHPRPYLRNGKEGIKG
jgi:hypothetical protein